MSAKGAVGISAGAVIVLIATNGEKFFSSLQAGWVFILNITSQMPLGLASFLLAWALGLSIMASLRRWIPEPKRQDYMHLRMGFIELASSVAAFFAVWMQDKTLLGLMLGIVAGLSVSILYRALAAAGSTVLRRIYLPPEDKL